MQLTKEVLYSILSMSFGYCKPSEFPSFLQTLKVFNHVEMPVAKSIMYLSRGFNNSSAHDEYDSIKAEGVIKENRLNIASTIDKIANILHLDNEMVLLVTRLKQGDFYVIQHIDPYLNPILPTDYLKRMAMGLCGLLINRIPLCFPTQLNHYPDKFTYHCNVEGAMELMAQTLGINPLLTRMVALG